MLVSGLGMADSGSESARLLGLGGFVATSNTCNEVTSDTGEAGRLRGVEAEEKDAG